MLSINTHQDGPVVRVATAEKLPRIMLKKKKKKKNKHQHLYVSFISPLASMIAQTASTGSTLYNEWQVEYGIKTQIISMSEAAGGKNNTSHLDVDAVG